MSHTPVVVSKAYRAELRSGSSAAGLGQNLRATSKAVEGSNLLELATLPAKGQQRARYRGRQLIRHERKLTSSQVNPVSGLTWIDGQRVGAPHFALSGWRILAMRSKATSFDRVWKVRTMRLLLHCLGSSVAMFAAIACSG